MESRDQVSLDNRSEESWGSQQRKGEMKGRCKPKEIKKAHLKEE